MPTKTMIPISDDCSYDDPVEIALVDGKWDLSCPPLYFWLGQDADMAGYKAWLADQKVRLRDSGVVLSSVTEQAA